MKYYFWNFWFSQRRGLYLRLARKYRTSPWRVYNLAHGSRIRKSLDDKILKELEELGIIKLVNPW